MLSDGRPTNDELASIFDDALLGPLDAAFVERLSEDLLKPLPDWVYEPLDASLIKRLGEDVINAALLERVVEDRPGSSVVATIAAGDAGAGSHLQAGARAGDV